MKLIKTRPQYRCDFCRYRAGLVGMTNHEKICWRNPDRFCEYCGNKGYYLEDHGDIEGSVTEKILCPYCSKFKPISNDEEYREFENALNESN